MPTAKTISELQTRLVDFRDRRNWRQFHTPKDLALSISIESAELLELFQWKKDEAVEKAKTEPDFRAAASDEIADVMIYLTLLSGELGIDPLEAASAKMERNEKRFPESPA